MPNTPALVGEGMTGVSYDSEELSQEEIQVIHQFFQSFGRITVVEEKLMDAVVCASGSSPAYVYMFMEALADSVVKYGIPSSGSLMAWSLRPCLVVPKWCWRQENIQDF